MITSVYAHILDEDRKINAQKFESAFYAQSRPTFGSSPGGTKGTGARHIGFGVPGGTASQVAGTGQHTGCIAGVGPIRKIGRENRISKSAFFISKAGKIVRSQLAGIQRKMYKIVPAERQKRSNETITKKPLVNHQKNGLQRSFLAPPGWVRTSGLSLRRRPLYPTELRGLIQKIFNFAELQDSNDSIFRRVCYIHLTKRCAGVL